MLVVAVHGLAQLRKVGEDRLLRAFTGNLVPRTGAGAKSEGGKSEGGKV